MRTLITGGQLLDHARSYEPAAILVEDGYIRHIGRFDGDADKVVDMNGFTLLPGFTDAHVHIAVSNDEYAPEGLRAMAAKGVTTVRDLGMLCEKPLDGYMQWLSSVNCPGYPRVYTAGRYIDIKNGYGAGHAPGSCWNIVVSTEIEGENAVAYQHERGTHGVKLGILDGQMARMGRPRITDGMARAIFGKARALGMWTSVHLTASDTLTGLLNAGCPITDSAHTPYDPIPDEAIEKMLAEDVGMVTTVGDPNRLPQLPPETARTFNKDAFLEMSHRRCETMIENLRRLHQAGVPISTGTDYGTDMPTGPEVLRALESRAGIPARELRWLKKAGMNTREIITAATLNGARLCFADNVCGSLDIGKYADIIAVPGELDPEFEKLVNVPWVMCRGEIVTDNTGG